MEGDKANRYAALQGERGVKILSKSALRNGWTFPKRKKHKTAQNTKQAIFLLLDVFYAHKKHKKHKTSNKRLSSDDFQMFFMRIKMLSFLFLFACMRFVLFVSNKRLSSS